MTARVLVAMSGGVDSAVAAARLVDAAYDVVGVTLHLWDYPDDAAQTKTSRCCAPEDQYDAKCQADALGIPHYTFDRRDLFAETVVAPFVAAYMAGETPSPCADCNRGVKLRELFALADRLGASHVATGHYARVVHHGGHPALAQGRDLAKDQSYFLYATPPAQLARLHFPLGDSTKAEVRAEATSRALPGANKGESQELCFIGSKPHGYAPFVEQRALAKVRPGAIVDQDGRVVGQHAGIHHFTVGQRKGLGVASPEPRYVTKVDAATGAVHLGRSDDLLSSGALLDDVTLAPSVELPRTARVRVRYRHDGTPGRIIPGDGAATGTLRVMFDEPVRAVTRGQIAVLYDDDRVLGGGRISVVGTA